jgi:hypothetical protein
MRSKAYKHVDVKAMVAMYVMDMHDDATYALASSADHFKHDDAMESHVE